MLSSVWRVYIIYWCTLACIYHKYNPLLKMNCSVDDHGECYRIRWIKLSDVSERNPQMCLVIGYVVYTQMFSNVVVVRERLVESIIFNARQFDIGYWLIRIYGIIITCDSEKNMTNLSFDHFTLEIQFQSTLFDNGHFSTVYTVGTLVMNAS